MSLNKVGKRSKWRKVRSQSRGKRASPPSGRIRSVLAPSAAAFTELPTRLEGENAERKEAGREAGREGGRGEVVSAHTENEKQKKKLQTLKQICCLQRTLQPRFSLYEAQIPGLKMLPALLFSPAGDKNGRGGRVGSTRARERACERHFK